MDPAMPLIAFVRHAQASFGTADYDELSAVGRQQADVVGVDLARRQRDTASLLMAAAGISCRPGVDEHWDEYDHFALLRRYIEPHRVDRASGDSRAFQRLLDEALAAWSLEADGTGWDAFAREALAALADLTAALDKGRDAIVVTSAGIVAALAAAMLGAPAVTAIALNRVAVNCAITTVLVGASGTSLLTFNDHAH